MNVEIYSKFKMEELLEIGPLKNVAVISFYSEPVNILTKPIDYTGKAERFMQINLPDIDEGGLEENGYTFDSFFTESNTVAEFIYKAYNDGFDFACQCQFGFSRSAACAAAILEHFEGKGDKILLNDKYQPNKLVYGKLLSALERKMKINNSN